MSVYVRHDSTFVYRNSVIGEKSGIVPNMGNGVYFNNPMSILIASSIWYATFLALLCVNFSSLCLKEI